MADKKTNLARLNDALDSGDFSAARDTLDRMSSDELDLMREEFGEHIVQKLAGVRRRRRGPKKGRVIVINGIMGAHLYTIDRKDDEDHVWINFFRIMFGQMARLELTPAGEQVKKEYRVEPRRLHKTYLPLALELERNWDVLHFPFDWRLDMDLEAKRLAGRIEDWAHGEPVHLVAHSMGGVLSRRMIQKFPSVWQSMADPDGLRRGGRLIMLGTPNRGSFAIPEMLTGKDKAVKFLALLDLPGSRKRFLRCASSFPGGYQMMPSPLVDLQDDHDKLYKQATWGKHRVINAHLGMARRFHIDIDAVLSPERLVYVAGYGIKTTQRIEVEKPGSFRYEIGTEGDGRVPHSLGLLDGVTTQWVKEKHGDLPLNDQVMEGIHDLLEMGKTVQLEAARPTIRGFSESKWVDDDDLVEFSAEDKSAAAALGKRLRASKRGTRAVKLTPAARQAADAMFDDFLAAAPAGAFAKPGDLKTTRTGKKKKLRVEVHWGDITKVRGSVYCVGHYEGVLPQQAEWALDTVISGTRKLDEMVLRQHTQRGVLRGQLGAINIYPWARHYDPPRTVAIAGMGYPGQFTDANLRTLARQLAWAVGTLPKTETLCTVLIGSGDGGLSTGQAVRGMILGVVDALESELKCSVKKLRFVELYRERAEDIFSQVKLFAEQERDRVTLDIPKNVRRGQSGRISKETSLALAAAALVDAKTSKSANVTSAASNILRRIPNDVGMRNKVHNDLQEFASYRDKVTDIAKRIRVEIDPGKPGTKNVPSRLSFWRTETATHVAALTNTAVKPERISRLDPSLVDQLRLKLEDPDDTEVARFGSLLNRLIVPRDFRDVLDAARSMVIEVDRPMSTVNWEMLTVDPDSATTRDCLALRHPLARQLRTEYSPPPSAQRAASGGLRALVIGDPGDPQEGENLPGAREEALQVADLLSKAGVDVTLRLGAPVNGRGPVSGILPASRLEVLELLQTERFDILHYAGHGDFQDAAGMRSGWLFKGGMLSAAELETVDSPPRLIVANACLSARTSTRIRGGDRVAPEFGDAGLLPSLADEFLRRGVRDYVGTAWEIDDEGAIRFATTLYGALGLSASGSTQTLGDALHAARQDLYREVERYWSLWAAYQHYGDPLLLL